MFFDFTNPLFKILIFPSIGLSISIWLMILYPPKKINWWYGYRTPRSKQSQEAWDFAQAFSAPKFRLSSILLISLTILGACLPHFDKNLARVIALSSLVLLVGIPIIQTERALKKRFEDKE